MSEFILSKPVEVVKNTKDGKVTEVLESFTIVRDPQVGDFLDFQLQSMKIKDFMSVFGAITGQPATIINKMSLADMTEAMMLISGFFGSSLPTSSAV